MREKNKIQISIVGKLPVEYEVIGTTLEFAEGCLFVCRNERIVLIVPIDKLEYVVEVEE